MILILCIKRAIFDKFCRIFAVETITPWRQQNNANEMPRESVRTRTVIVLVL